MATKKFDLGFIVKVVVCGVAFVSAMAYFSSLCAGVVSDYSVLFGGAIVMFLVKLAIAAVIFLLMTSVVAALLRPTWVAMIVYAVGAFMYPVLVGFERVTLISAAVALVLLILYLLFAVHQFDNQIKFSTHPLLGKKLLMGSLLAALVAVSVGLGYNVDSAAKNYVLPPFVKGFYVDQMTSIVKGTINAQKATDKQKEAALGEATKSFNEIFDKAEKELKPSQGYIGILFGVVAFIALQIVFILVSIVALILVPLLFWILEITHFTHLVTEKVEAKRLTLRTVG